MKKKNNPIGEPRMPGAHNYDNAPTLASSPAAVLLAQVAAPFAAAGMTDEAAAHRAFWLMHACENYLFKLQSHEVFSHPLLARDLAGAIQDLKRDKKSVRSYLFEASPNSAAEIWKAALAGERAFSRPLMKQLEQIRDARYATGRRERTDGQSGAKPV